MAETTETGTAGKKPSRGRPTMPDEKRDDMRRRIADAADHLFQSEGYSNVSMRRIAKAVGCTPMALYSYYDAKIDILRTLWDGVFDAVFDGLASVEPREDARDYLAAISNAYVDYWLQNQDHYRLVFMAEGVTQPDVSIFLDGQASMERYAIFADAIVLGRPEPLSAEDLKMKLDLLICLLHGIAHNQITISGYDWSSAGSLVERGVTAIVGRPAG